MAELLNAKRDLNGKLREAEQLLTQSRAAKKTRDEEHKALATELAQLTVRVPLLLICFCIVIVQSKTLPLLVIGAKSVFSNV